VHTHITLHDAQSAGRDVTAQEGQLHRRRRAGLPDQALAVQPHPAAFDRALVGQTTRLCGAHHLAGVVRQQRKVHIALVALLCVAPPAVFGRAAQEGDDLQVAAIGKAHQRVVRGAIGMGAPALHGKAQGPVVGNGRFQFFDEDDDVVQAE
jgi:hypothetical protein